MSDPTATPPVAASGFTPNDAVAILNTIGTLAAVINPALAGAAAAISGAAALINNTILPAIRHAHDIQLTAVQQAQLALDSAKLRAEVGAPPAKGN